MRLFVLGANGRTGIELVDLALAHGHEVTAFVRSPDKVSRRDERLRIVKGDPHRADELAAALPGHDAVLSALGPRPREALTGTTLLEECAAATVAAMGSVGLRRLLIVSSALLFPVRGPLFAVSRLVLGPHIRDLRAMEELVRASPLDWTIARPPRLVSTRDERFAYSEDELPARSLVLSWRALAVFLIGAVEGERHRRKVVGLCR
jgi:putative NADH-flavin reductase